MDHSLVQYISRTIPSYHKRLYLECGPTEYKLLPSSLSNLMFIKGRNPTDSLIYFMLMIEPPPEKTHFTFFFPSFHHQFYPDEEPKEPDSSSWQVRV